MAARGGSVAMQTARLLMADGEKGMMMKWYTDRPTWKFFTIPAVSAGLCLGAMQLSAQVPTSARPADVGEVAVPPAPSVDGPVFASQVVIPPAPEGALPETGTNLPAVERLPSPPPVSSHESAAEDDWQISITPMEKRKENSIVASYEAVYHSIPFRRAEYLANPSYRHDATIEVLFGQMRPTVINRTDSPQRVVNPRPQLTQPYPISKGELYSYWPLLQYSYPLPLLSPIQ